MAANLSLQFLPNPNENPAAAVMCENKSLYGTGCEALYSTLSPAVNQAVVESCNTSVCSLHLHKVNGFSSSLMTHHHDSGLCVIHHGSCCEREKQREFRSSCDLKLKNDLNLCSFLCLALIRSSMKNILSRF